MSGVKSYWTPKWSDSFSSLEARDRARQLGADEIGVLLLVSVAQDGDEGELLREMPSSRGVDQRR